MIFLHYIHSMKKDIEILPIFNPEKCNFWDNFQSLYTITYQHDYNDIVTPANLQTLMQGIRDSHANILFGAYDGGKMVGCIVASTAHRRAHIQYLHVLPEYQNCKIGTQLLLSAEGTSSLHVPRAELTAWGKAENFYRRHKYTSPTHNNKYEKDIKNAGNYSIHPVFSRGKKILQTFSAISGTPYDTLKQEIRHDTPVFVQKHPNDYISCYGYINARGESVVHSRPGCTFAHQQIEKRLHQYRQFQPQTR